VKRKGFPSVPRCLGGEKVLRVTEHDSLTERVIGAAIEVHRVLGDGTHLKVKEFEHEPVFESETASSP
jgi:hypothetical protein